MPASSNIKAEIGQDIAGFIHDPLSHALYCYPWGSGQLLNHEGPRVWQREMLDTIGKHLRSKNRFTPLKIAVASGHGIGKSSCIAMITKWAMDTMIDTKIVMTANTETQLRTKTWPEISKWWQMAITKDWFRLGGLSINSVHPEFQKTWRLDAVSWSETNTDAFQGLHNEGKRLIVIMDEAAGIADKVAEVTEGAMTDENTEIIWIAFGNPTRATGWFRECFRRNAHRWITKNIDSRDVEGTNKELIQQWIDDYGVDSDFAKIRIRGMFPNQSAYQFIPESDVDAAYGKHLRETQYNHAAKIIGVDPAWTGSDELAIVMRQGLACKVLMTLPKNDNDVLIANHIARFEDDEKADAVFIDGGYGTGIYSVGKTNGRNWQLVWFGGKSIDPACLNKRSEMWNAMRMWFKEGAAIPKDLKLRDEILSIEVVPTNDGKIKLESKEQMKVRGLPSPGRADALALTFAMNVLPKANQGFATQGKVKTEYDPYR